VPGDFDVVVSLAREGEGEAESEIGESDSLLDDELSCALRVDFTLLFTGVGFAFALDTEEELS